MKFELISYKGIPSGIRIEKFVRNRTETFTKDKLQITHPVVDNIIGEPVVTWVPYTWSVDFTDYFHTIKFTTLEGLMQFQSEVGTITISNKKNEFLGTEQLIEILDDRENEHDD